MTKEITRDSTLAEILELPEAEKTLAQHNLPCLWCPFARFEAKDLKIGQICQAYGIEIGKLLQELNNLILKGKTKKG